MNEIVFPAGILQPPFYDPKADDSVNYGGMGAVIGHEITHGFDDQGAKFDAQGNLKDWWTANDAKGFEDRINCVRDQYKGYVIVDDVHINSKLTSGEDVADLGGQLLANAFQAPIRRLPKEHIGFLRIEFTKAGRKDPLYHGLPGYQQAFQWHEDCFDLPSGALALAHHEDGANQAFCYLDAAYGLQYHVELTEEMLDTWLHDPELKKEFIDEYGMEQYEKVEREAVELYPTYASHAEMLIENFLRMSKLIE